MAVQTKTVERKIFFFRTLVQPVGSFGNDAADFDPMATCQNLAKIPHNERAHTLPSGDRLTCWPSTVQGRPRLILGGIRHTGLPHIEKVGTTRPLTIDDDEGLVENTHIVFFDHGVVGVEFNFYGPRVRQLSTLLSAKFPMRGIVNFNAIANRDSQAKLAHLQDVRLLEMQIHRHYTDTLKTTTQGHMFDAMDALGESADAPVVTVRLGSEPRSRKHLGQRALDLVRDLVGWPQAREAMNTFRVQGKDDRTDKVELFDFLEDKMVFRRKIIKEQSRHRAIRTEDVYEAIDSAYEELKDAFPGSVSLST